MQLRKNLGAPDTTVILKNTACSSQEIFFCRAAKIIPENIFVKKPSKLFLEITYESFCRLLKNLQKKGISHGMTAKTIQKRPYSKQRDTSHLTLPFLERAFRKLCLFGFFFASDASHPQTFFSFFIVCLFVNIRVFFPTFLFFFLLLLLVVVVLLLLAPHRSLPFRSLTFEQHNRRATKLQEATTKKKKEKKHNVYLQCWG